MAAAKLDSQTSRSRNHCKKKKFFISFQDKSTKITSWQHWEQRSESLSQNYPVTIDLLCIEPPTLALHYLRSRPSGLSAFEAVPISNQSKENSPAANQNKCLSVLPEQQQQLLVATGKISIKKAYLQLHYAHTTFLGKAVRKYSNEHRQHEGTSHFL